MLSAATKNRTPQAELVCLSSLANCSAAPKTRRPAKTRNLHQIFSSLRPGPSITQFVAQKTHSSIAVPVGRISQGPAVFCVRNASISHIVRSMSSPSTSRTSALRRAVDGVAPPLSLQVPGPRGAEEVARADATATQASRTPGCVETFRRWHPSRWSRRLVAVPDSSCLQRSSPGRC